MEVEGAVFEKLKLTMQCYGLGFGVLGFRNPKPCYDIVVVQCSNVSISDDFASAKTPSSNLVHKYCRSLHTVPTML